MSTQAQKFVNCISNKLKILVIFSFEKFKTYLKLYLALPLAIDEFLNDRIGPGGRTPDSDLASLLAHFWLIFKTIDLDCFTVQERRESKDYDNSTVLAMELHYVRKRRPDCTISVGGGSNIKQSNQYNPGSVS